MSKSATLSTPSSTELGDESIIPKIYDFDYIPFVSDLSNKEDAKFFSVDPDVNLSTNIDYPKFTLGFHHYIHSNKNKMEIIKQFQDKKKVYLVMNKFERYVDNYDDDIGHRSITFFDLKNLPNILSRGFYKLWEILHMFDLIDLKKTNFVSAHLAEGPGSFIQATMFYRDKYAEKLSKNDKYYAITLHAEDEGHHIPALEKSFVDYYEKEKPKRFILHKTYSKQVAGGYADKDNGDLTNPKTILLFGGQLANDGVKADLVTADGGFDWDNENTQEQEAFRLIFAQIFAAFKVQSKNGHFICKFFETFTESNLKLIYLLSQMYEHVYFVKPLTSRPSNSEKYAVCMNFKFNESDAKYKTVIKKMTEIHNLLHENKDLNIVNLWPELSVPELYKKTIIFSNKTIANKQLKSINDITTFINAQNYYGDIYQMHRQLQIDANKYWIKLFMPEKKDFNVMLQHIHDSTKKIIDKTNQIVVAAKYD